MKDYYQDGFDDGYGRNRYDDEDYPKNDGDRYSYRRGYEKGLLRREISQELDEDYEY